MPFVPFANTAEIEIRHLLDNQKVENTLYFTQATAYDFASLQTLAETVRDAWVSDMMPNLANGLHLVEVFARDLSVAEGAEATAVPASPVTGAAGAQVSNNVTLCVSLRSGAAGRSNRGRNYVCGVPASGLADANHFSSDFITAILAAYGTLQDATSAADFTWVVASRFHNGAPRSVGSTQVITAVVCVDNVVDSQRRRLPGRGV